jgi:hypothetical protein
MVKFEYQLPLSNGGRIGRGLPKAPTLYNERANCDGAEADEDVDI